MENKHSKTYKVYWEENICYRYETHVEALNEEDAKSQIQGGKENDLKTQLVGESISGFYITSIAPLTPPNCPCQTLSAARVYLGQPIHSVKCSEITSFIQIGQLVTGEILFQKNDLSWITVQDAFDNYSDVMGYPIGSFDPSLVISNM